MLDRVALWVVRPSEEAYLWIRYLVWLHTFVGTDHEFFPLSTDSKRALSVTGKSTDSELWLAAYEF